MPYPALGTALAALRDVTAGAPADTLDDPTPCAAWTVAQVLYHAAADQHAWAASVGDGEMPGYNPFDPPRSLDDGVENTVAAALAEQLTPGAQATADSLRGFAYATALSPQPDDDAVAALLRYLGRDPQWAASKPADFAAS